MSDESNQALDPQSFLDKLPYTVQTDMRILRKLYIDIESQHHTNKDERTLSNVQAHSTANGIQSLTIMRAEIADAMKRRDKRYLKHNGVSKRVNAQRSKYAIADRIRKHDKIGPLTVIALFKFNIEIDYLNPQLAQFNGQYRCQCDCGRIVYKRTAHLDEAIKGDRVIESCGKGCGLKLRSKAKPVVTPPVVPDAIKQAFANLLDEPLISDSEPPS